jgi:hypothetical protein
MDPTLQVFFYNQCYNGPGYSSIWEKTILRFDLALNYLHHMKAKFALKYLQ